MPETYGLLKCTKEAEAIIYLHNFPLCQASNKGKLDNERQTVREIFYELPQSEIWIAEKALKFSILHTLVLTSPSVLLKVCL